ncbi:MAG: hypothetical protein WC419_06680 [Candidatus Omnitrophota bacterium]
MARLKFIQLLLILAGFMLIAGCGNKVAKDIPKTGDIKISVSATNSLDNETLRKIGKDSAIVNGNIESYARDKISALLKQAGFPAENDSRDYSLNVNMSIGIGLERKILTDPKTSITVTGGEMVLSVPVLKLDGRLLADGKEISPAISFEGGLNFGASDWQGITRLCDMGIGHCLKDLAKNGIAAEPIVIILAKEELLPRKPYSDSKISMFGNEIPVRFHQDGNLWEAFGDIGEPAVEELRNGAKDKDQDIREEATKILDSK